jgi:predicted transcriptional regulator
MIRGKTRHQLFLPHELSKRLAVMAKSQNRARSDLLVEMVDAWMNRRAAPQVDERIADRLDRIARAVEAGNREAYIISNSLHRFMKHQLIYAAALPVPGPEAIALGKKRFADFQDSLAQALAEGRRTASPIEDEPNEGTDHGD